MPSIEFSNTGSMVNVVYIVSLLTPKVTDLSDTLIEFTLEKRKLFLEGVSNLAVHLVKY
jgi:hypothetical protein